MSMAVEFTASTHEQLSRGKQAIAELAATYDREHHDRLVEVLHTQLANADPLLRQKVHDADVRAKEAETSLEALAAQAAQAANDEEARATRASRLLAKAEAERAAVMAERDAEKAVREELAQELAQAAAAHEAALAAAAARHAAALGALRAEAAAGADALLEATAAEQAARDDASTAAREAEDARAQLESANANLQQLMALHCRASEDSSRMTDAIEAAEFGRQRALEDTGRLRREHARPRSAEHLVATKALRCHSYGLDSSLSLRVLQYFDRTRCARRRPHARSRRAPWPSSWRPCARSSARCGSGCARPRPTRRPCAARSPTRARATRASATRWAAS